MQIIPRSQEGEVAMDRESALDHLYRIFHDDLGMCGCGQPAAAYSLIQDLLALAPLHEDSRWRLAETLTGGGGAHHIIMSTLDRAGLIEHGSSINGSWLTDKGKWCLAAMRQLEYADLGEAGYPHDGEDCTDTCWAAPVPTA